MSDYFEPIKKIIKGKQPLSRSGDYEYYICCDDKDMSHLCISPGRVTYKGYTVPLNESELEDLYIMSQTIYSLQEEKNKKSALDELKGEK